MNYKGKFQPKNLGKYKGNLDNMIKCEICNKEIENLAKLSKHIQHYHKEYTQKEYYDLYLKKTTEDGKCIICKNSTKFIGIVGYYRTCSHKCGGLLHISNLRADIEKMKKFSLKCSDKQRVVWSNRSNDIKNEIFNKSIQTNKKRCLCYQRKKNMKNTLDIQNVLLKL